MKKIHNNFLEPPEQKLSSLIGHYQAGRYVEAEKLALSINKEFPKNKVAWKVLAAVLKQNGRINEALIICQKSVQLDPKDAEAHKNLGIILYEQSRLNEAEESFRKAIILQPNFAMAHSNLGILLQIQGKLKESEESFKKAIALAPDYAEAHNNLGVVLKDQGKLDEALSAFIQAINLNSNNTDTYSNLGIAIEKIRFNSSDIKLYPLLIQLLSSGNFVRPLDLATSILSLLKHDPLIKNLLLEENFAKSLKEANTIIVNLNKLKLIHYLMRLCPLPNLQFEKFFMNMRKLLLNNLNNIDTSAEVIYFLSSLSIQCFTNEYVYVEKDEETKLVENLENEILHTIKKSEQPEVKKILCLASYRPLHKYNWCQKLEALDNLKEVKSRLIDEPYTESVIMSEIPKLGKISDDVSQKVRAQYEENPYPRWVKTALPAKAKSISEICVEENLHLYFESIKKVNNPSVLIAGCGTGQHPIQTALRFSNCKATAIDLSLASLAYAKRKTNELGITNLKYLQADILSLDQLEQKFDIVDSVGVLHHMNDPMTGWRALTDLLKPGGLMRIGLYSELARKNIIDARNEIALAKIGTSKSEMREFRQKISISNDKNYQRLAKSKDFFSLSMLRDLIFHVQEHRFTLPQIKSCLDELKLKFCGFTTKDAISNLRKFYGKDADIYDLSLWHQYEKNNPQAFAAMYQFWCQKL